MTEDAPGDRDELEEMGRRLRAAREEVGFTQEDVGGALGVPRTSIHAMETGKRNVSAPELRKLSRLYRRSVEWLLGEQEAEISPDSALFRAAGALSVDDREQVLRFAQFLASGAQRPRSGE